MNRIYLIVCLLVLSFPGVAQDLESILEKNTEAHGGTGNFERIGNVRFQLAIREPGFKISGTYVATRDGNMRIDIEAGGQRVFSEGLYQNQAWQWTPGSGKERPRCAPWSTISISKTGIFNPKAFSYLRPPGNRSHLSQPTGIFVERVNLEPVNGFRSLPKAW